MTRIWHISPTNLLGVALLLAIAGTVLSSRCAWIDRGQCLASHSVAKHEDAYTLCLPAVGFDGQTTLACHLEDAVDWTETVCDQWEFPHGRAEQGP